jgi:uncharacterized protein
MDHTVAYQQGIALFNTSEYWHAHEAWESCWLAAQEPERTLYKGLIQTAAALVHAQRNNPRGLWRNWAKARPRLVALGTSAQGIALQQLVGAMDRFVLDQAAAPLPRIELVPVAELATDTIAAHSHPSPSVAAARRSEA